MSGYEPTVSNTAWLNEELRKVRAASDEANRRAMQNVSRVRYGTIDTLWASGDPLIKWSGDSEVGVDYVTGWESDITPVPGGSYAFMRDITGGYFILASRTQTLPFPNQLNTAVTLQNGWTNYDTVWHGLAITKTVEGIVMFTGLIKGGTATAGTLLFTLPEGFRPDYDLLFPVMASAGSTGIAQILVRTNGQVTFYSGGPTGFVSMTNIVFPAAGVATWKLFGIDAGFTMANSWVPFTDGVNTFGPLRMWIEPVSGMVYTQGVLKNGSTTNMVAMTNPLPVGYRPELDNIFTSAGATNVSGSWRAIGPTPGVGTANTLAYTYGGNVRLPIMGVFKPISSTLAWSSVSYLNGWSRYGASYNDFRYTKTPGGQVYVQGLIANGPVPSSAAGVVPVGYRTKFPLLAPTWSADVLSRTNINVDGVLDVSPGSSAWFSFDGVTYVAEQ